MGSIILPINGEFLPSVSFRVRLLPYFFVREKPRQKTPGHRRLHRAREAKLRGLCSNFQKPNNYKRIFIHKTRTFIALKFLLSEKALNLSKVFNKFWKLWKIIRGKSIFFNFQYVFRVYSKFEDFNQT